jgi:hypothetical protein
MIRQWEQHVQRPCGGGGLVTLRDSERPCVQRGGEGEEVKREGQTGKRG